MKDKTLRHLLLVVGSAIRDASDDAVLNQEIDEVCRTLIVSRERNANYVVNYTRAGEPASLEIEDSTFQFHIRGDVPALVIRRDTNLDLRSQNWDAAVQTWKAMLRGRTLPRPAGLGVRSTNTDKRRGRVSFFWGRVAASVLVAILAFPHNAPVTALCLLAAWIFLEESSFFLWLILLAFLVYFGQSSDIPFEDAVGGFACLLVWGSLWHEDRLRGKSLLILLTVGIGVSLFGGQSAKIVLILFLVFESLGMIIQRRLQVMLLMALGVVAAMASISRNSQNFGNTTLFEFFLIFAAICLVGFLLPRGEVPNAVALTVPLAFAGGAVISADSMDALILIVPFLVAGALRPKVKRFLPPDEATSSTMVSIRPRNDAN